MEVTTKFRVSVSVTPQGEIDVAEEGVALASREGLSAWLDEFDLIVTGCQSPKHNIRQEEKTNQNN